MALVYEPLEARTTDALAAIQAYSFNVPQAVVAPWWDLAGREHVRVVRDGDEVLGGAFLIWMGQWLLGRRVPICGVAGVAVGPQARGRGVARFLMGEVLRESRARGVPVATLYASTVPLYRSAGFERAGGRYEARVRPSQLPHAAGPLAVRRMQPADQPAVEALRSERARTIHGALELGPYLWQRLRAPRTGTATSFVLEGPDGLEGHATTFSPHPAPDFTELSLTDWSAATPAALRTLLGFLGSHSTVWETLSFATEPRDPLLFALADRWYETHCREHWLARVIDPCAALEARGWPASASGTLELELADETLPEAAGRFTLRLEDGRAACEPGGAGRVRLQARALAALATGHQSAESLRLAGLLEADPQDAARATALFAAPAAAMLVRF